MIIKVENLSFSYPGRKVLENVTFEIGKGECVALLGVNGAGKSTLLKCINRILKPLGGVVLVEGKVDISRLKRRDIAKLIGYTPQHEGTSGLSVFEMICLGRKPYRNFFLRRNDYKIVEEVIYSLGLQEISMKALSELSGGEFQKVLIARALAQKPKILLMDEPTSHLDLKNQLEVMSLIKKVTKRSFPPLATIICLHDINLALRFADRFIFLKDNSIYAITDKAKLDPAIIYEVYGVRVEIFWSKGYPFVVLTGDEDEEAFYSNRSSYKFIEHSL